MPEFALSAFYHPLHKQIKINSTTKIVQQSDTVVLLLLVASECRAKGQSASKQRMKLVAASERANTGRATMRLVG